MRKARSKSGFKLWVRIVALFIAAIFVPEQIAWSVDFNPGILWQNPAYQPLYSSISSLSSTPLEAKAFNNAVALSLLRSLKPLAGKKRISAVKLKEGLEIPKKTNLDKETITRLYSWLKKPATETVPCSAYTLYNLLQSYHKPVHPASVSSLLLFIDILLGNVQSGQKTIYNSLYAMQKTAQYFGLNLYPAKIKKLTPEFLKARLPFIAHLENPAKGIQGHFVYVKRIDKEKVYYFYDKGTSFLPLEKFIQDFSGYCLLSRPYEYALNSIEPVSNEQAQKIMGARYASKYRSYSPFDAIVTAAFASATIVYTAYHPPTSITQAVFQPAVTYGITYMGQKAGWNPYLTAGLATFGGSMVGSVGSMNFKSFTTNASAAWARVGREALANAATAATITGIKYAGHKLKMHGLEDIGAVYAGQAVNWGMRGYFNRDWRY